jgi:RNA polymerase sigma-70 factor (ECF subfamily)
LPLQDPHAWVEDLARRHEAGLRRFLRTRVRNDADIPDLVQEVFLRLLRIPSVATVRTPEAYIFTIARHVAIEYGLKRSGGASQVELDAVLAESGDLEQLDPALEVSAQQCVEALDDALLELSPKVQATFLFHRRDGLTIEQTSARLGISRPMAKKYLVKALVHFRKRLKEAE